MDVTKLSREELERELKTAHEKLALVTLWAERADNCYDPLFTVPFIRACDQAYCLLKYAEIPDAKELDRDEELKIIQAICIEVDGSRIQVERVKHGVASTYRRK